MAIKQFGCIILSSLILLSACFDLEEEEVIYIKPSPSSACPVAFCSTLSEFAANQAEGECNITLKLLPGNHNLNSTLLVANITSLSIITNSNTSDSNVSCRKDASFAFENIIQVLLQGLRFIGCGNSEVLLVTNFTVENSLFIGQEESGTALMINESNVTFVNCSFLFNAKGTYKGPLNITKFWRKHPQRQNKTDFPDSDYSFVGGAIMATHSNIAIFGSRFEGNHADIGGGIYAISSSIMIRNSLFVENSACMNKTKKFCFGGVIYNENDDPERRNDVTIVKSVFHNNIARYGGVLTLFKDCRVSINSSTFENNALNHSSTYEAGGVMALYEQSTATIDDCQFQNNGGLFFDDVSTWFGAVVTADNSVVAIRNSTFRNNRAEFGSAVSITSGNLTIHRSNFSDSQAFQGGVLSIDNQCHVIICGSKFDSNVGTHKGAQTKSNGGAIMMTNGGKLNITRTLFINNTAARGGAISVATKVEVVIINCSFAANGATALKGGAIELSHSDITFYGQCNMTDNFAINGGAVYAASESVLNVNGELMINDNAANDSGGGINLYRSKLNCQINSTVKLLSNKAVNNKSKGGGLFAINSIVAVFSDRDLSKMSSITFTKNTAIFGGGIYLALATELHIIKSGNNYTKTIYNLCFIENSAGYGGAIYNADKTNYEICASDSYYYYNTSIGAECFLQINSPMETNSMKYNIKGIEFVNNTVSNTVNTSRSDLGQAVYGGLLDRCIIAPGAEILLTRQRLAIDGVSYILNVSNLNSTDAISSSPVALCFCKPGGHPDCSYQPASFNVMKGETFQISLVAVDQVNRTLPNVTVYSSLKYAKSGLGEGQMAQITTHNCTDFKFSIYSPKHYEQITIYADGPCRNASRSQKTVNVKFLNCFCPVGFQPKNPEKNATSCECVCDSKLKQYVSNCTNQTLTRVGNIWITYLNDTNVTNDYDYLIYPYCPLDYCLPPSSDVKINLNVGNGADAQCANSRSGILCGVCQPGLSLSLGSSHCVLCSNSWWINFVVTIVAAALTGVLFVAVILILKLTVAVGTLNGLIFYANIIDASSTTFFEISSPSTKFFYALISWLNLEIGLDVCFYDGMTTYWKTWLQLVFPLYVMALVVIIIIVSNHWKRFSDLIGQKNPVATLATLILFSYAKLLRTIITALSMATLHYPDGSHKIKWLPDATIDYSDGKHIVMVLAAIFILVIGIAFTLLLFFWQWVVRWVKSTKLHHFVEPYLIPYLSKYRYWTGLLLLARVAIYLTISLNGTGDPSINLLAIIVVTSNLLFLKGHFGQIYKDWKVDGIEMVCYLNIVLFSAVKMFTLDSQMRRNDTIAAIISGSIMLLLLLCVLAYHIMHFNVCSNSYIQKFKRMIYGNNFNYVPINAHQCEPTATVIEGLPHRNKHQPKNNRDSTENLQDITGQLFKSIDNGRSRASTTAQEDDSETPLLNDTTRSTSKYTY